MLDGWISGTMPAKVALGRYLASLRRAAVAGVLMAAASFSACIRAGYEAQRIEPPGAGSARCGDARVDAPETCDTAIAAGEDGACPSDCAGDDPCARNVLLGSGCQTRCQLVVIERAINADGCCPKGASGREDSDCIRCGDGIVEPGETCDPPDACPTSENCTSSAPCIEARLTGDPQTCSSSCELAPIEACLDDGCCPPGCSFGSDADCSSLCGDGHVDTDAGETCEADDAVLACAESCDDADPCTLDIELGSAANCNVQCVNTPITRAADGDGCCLAGSTNLEDRDCAPVCGNDVIESGEQCDGGTICAGDCTALFNASLLHRYRFTGQGTIARDWLGNADGMLVRTSLDGSGNLTLAGGTSDQYVDLPNGLISQLSDATFEAWVTWSNAVPTDHERIFDFGTSGAGENGQGGKAAGYFYLTPSLMTDRRPQLSFAPPGSSTPDYVHGPVGSFPASTITHVAAVFSGSQRMMWLYLNGELLGSAHVSGTLSLLTDNNNWLGRSQFTNDAEFGGILHEFRIYDQALSPDEINQSYAAGPDPEDR